MGLERVGLKAYGDPRLALRHKNSVKFFATRSGCLPQRNRVYLVPRYGKWYHRLAFHLGVVLVELPAKVLVRSLEGRGRFVWACVLGYIDGVAGGMGRGACAGCE